MISEKIEKKTKNKKKTRFGILNNTLINGLWETIFSFFVLFYFLNFIGV